MRRIENIKSIFGHIPVYETSRAVIQEDDRTGKHWHRLCHSASSARQVEYFEFGHWTESVQAYYTKVQYKYKGGNYLLWLRKIGYAENPNYIREVIGVLRML